jgi:proteasome beta subunit
MQAELKLYELRHDKPATVEAAATLLANILTQYKFYPFYVQLLLGGVDERPRLFSIDMLGGITEEKMTSTGSGSPIAYGVLEELFHAERDITTNLPIAAKAVAAAMRRDAASGERVDLVTVTRSGFKRFDKEEIAKLVHS